MVIESKPIYYRRFEVREYQTSKNINYYVMSRHNGNGNGIYIAHLLNFLYYSNALYNSTQG